MAMTKKIHVKSAEVKTAAVTISHLTINARKMTLSVFRQIQRGDLLQYDSSGQCLLAGIPWGIVNYYWGDQSPAQLHVLWQDGNELRRDLINQSPSFFQLNAAFAYWAYNKESSYHLLQERPYIYWDGGYYHGVSPPNNFDGIKIPIYLTEEEDDGTFPRGLYKLMEKRKKAWRPVLEKMDKERNTQIALLRELDHLFIAV